MTICDDLIKLHGSLGSPERVEAYLEAQVRQLGDELIAYDNKEYFEEVQEKLRQSPPYPLDDSISPQLENINKQVEEHRLKLAALDREVETEEKACNDRWARNLQRDIRTAIDAVHNMLAVTGVTRYDLSQLGTLFSWLAQHQESISNPEVASVLIEMIV